MRACAGSSLLARYSGSSPLTRGTPVRFKPSFSLIRFIPAYAGNSRETVSRSKSKSVHPRLRGELYGPSAVVAKICGSSPLTRGTLSAELEKMINQSVHPRLRGELRTSFFVISDNSGSSPLTRGTQSCVQSEKYLWRFIPAYAGNSSSGLTASGITSVHPRLRGELIGLARRLRRRTGSSPLTRGTHLKTV